MADRLYTITEQIPTRELRGGRLTDVIEVHYQGPHNITGWVRVPVATATADQVDQLVKLQLDQQLAIAMLGDK